MDSAVEQMLHGLEQIIHCPEDDADLRTIPFPLLRKVVELMR